MFDSTRDRQRLLDVLAEVGVTPDEYSLFSIIHYGMNSSPSAVTVFAACDTYHPNGPVAEAVTRAALAACLDKGWLRIIDESALTEIRAELAERKILGPVYGFTEVGGVDFTPAGAELWLTISARRRQGADNIPFAYIDVVREKTSHYFRTLAAASGMAEDGCDQDAGISVSGPVAIGPWRAHWWQRFPEGYRIDIEEWRSWEGCSSRGGEQCHLFRNPERTDPLILRNVLDRRKIAFKEWAVLASVADRPNRFETHQLPYLTENASREFGKPISANEYLDGLDTCVRHGWLRVLDRQVISEIREVVQNDAAFLAVPRTAELRPEGFFSVLDPENPRRFVHVPRPDDHRYGEFDFTAEGAALYQAISADWLGAEWEDEFQISNGYYREEHRYCETEDGLRDVAQEWLAEGQDVRSVRVFPIGPWCVCWWQRYPAGFRMELVIGDPGAR